MYAEIGAFDAKSRLSELLQEVKRGQHYTITLRGQPIADLIPSISNLGKNKLEAVEAMRHIKKIKGIPSETITEWIEEGRR